MKLNYPYHGSEIAVIGVSARFPGADSVDEFWQNLCLQRESIRFFSDEELVAVGVPESLLKDPAYIKAKGVVRDCNNFDAAFFNYNDREAGLMDPQLRLYHECAWHALEDSGYSGRKNNNHRIGIFGGASANALWTAQYAEIAGQGGAAAYEVINVISRDFFNSRLAYKLDLKGPAVTVQTACSTALVAVHQACQSLLSGDSDVALAGAVSLSLNPALEFPEQQGYLHQEGMILSPDGHCRPFDQSAQGTVLSDGVGFVVLKRLQDAIDDGDRIYAVIKGSAINNDGREKIGFTAPSITGQRDVVEAALVVADIEPSTVGYIEAHGTGTNLGDPIEVQALKQAYQGFENAPCYLGSVKSNLGHLDTAAGMAGLIKTILTVKHGLIPATLHFSQLNVKCDLGSAKLRVVAINQEWRSEYPLRAGVSSFGIGGTNAHVIVEEYVGAQVQHSSAVSELKNSSPLFILPLSAKTEASLLSYQQQLQQWLPTGHSMQDVAYTLAERRALFDVRQALIVDAKGAVLFASNNGHRKIQPQQYWMFSGQGAQYLQMGKGLYEHEPVFHAVMDECLLLIAKLNGPDIRTFLLSDDTSEISEQDLRATQVAQLALFVVEYSLAKLFSSWGLQPKGLIGHSLGEYVAACFAGVFTLADALKIIIARGQLMSKTAAGSMISVHQKIQMVDLSPWPELSIAAINTEESFVVSGAESSIAEFAKKLTEKSVAHTLLRTSHAFHSALMDPILDEFAAVLGSVQLNPPQIAIISNLTGDWVSPEAMATVSYWVSHLREHVRFHEGIGRILRDEHAVLIEIGPGKTLMSFARQHPARQAQQLVLNSLRTAKESEIDLLGPRRVAAELYAQGASIKWQACNSVQGKHCSVPGYEFDKTQYLPRFKGFEKTLKQLSPEGFYHEHWVRSEAEEILEAQEELSGGAVALIMRAGTDAEIPLLQQLIARGLQLIEVLPGASFQRLDQNRFQLRPEIAEDYVLLSQELARAAISPCKVLQLWQADVPDKKYWPFAGLLLLVKAFNQSGFNDPLSIYAITVGAYRVAGDELLNSNAALVYGTIRVIGQEYSHIRCHLLDVRKNNIIDPINLLTKAICCSNLPLVTAYRGNTVWSREFKSLGSKWQAKSVRQGLRQKGVYIITGGFGGVGGELARHLARKYNARLILSSRQDHSCNPLLAEIKALGGDAIAHQLNIRKENSTKELFEVALNNFGQVNGIFHAAGIPGETMIQRHQFEKALSVIATKIDPAMQMILLAREYSLDLVVFFSSVTGILGGMGQADYCAANAGLDALAEQARSEGLDQVFSIRWDTWRETGMAVDAINGKLNILSHTGHPFLGDLISDSNPAVVFRKEITVNNCWALDEHWVMGVPTIPGTTYLEMAGAAYTQKTGNEAKKFENIYFLSPMSLAPNEVADLYTQLVRDGETYSFEVGSYHRSLQQWQVHARGQIGSASSNNNIATSITELQKQYQSRYLNNIQGAAHLGTLAMGVALSKEQQDAMMKYGERWTVIKEVWLGVQQGLARLSLAPEFGGDMTALSLHPSILDCALSYLRAFLDDGVYIPISYQRLTQYKALSKELFSQVKLTSALDAARGVMSFDIHLFSTEGELLADISDFTMRRIDAEFVNNTNASRSLVIPGFVRQFRSMSQGLTNAQALEALEQIVQSSHSLSLVAASDFGKRYAHADEGDLGLFSEEDVVVQQMRARPNISVEFIVPKAPQQKQLAEIWQQILGFEQVGIQDDFFELGGDSLLLMQIHKKIQTQFDTNIAIVELYNHSTIQRLTDFLSSQETNQVDIVLADVSDRIEKQKAAANRRKRTRQE